MTKQNLATVCIITHVYFRGQTNIPLPGPYSCLTEALQKLSYRQDCLQLPIKSRVADYLLDIVSIISHVAVWSLKNRQQKKIVIAIDPLSSLPLIFLKKIFRFKLIFYCVDFNRKRFKNSVLQSLYEMADTLSSQYSDQTWVVSYALKDYKKNNHNVNAIYMPNSSIFDRQWFEKGRKRKKGNRLIWGGSILTDQQMKMLFEILKKIQQIRPDITIHLVPTNKLDRFEKCIKDYTLKNALVYNVKTKDEWLRLVAACDIGLAIYDPDFDSTHFVEPIKIWEYMMCGIPFIISGEVSLSSDIKKSQVVYILGQKNIVVSKKSLENFIKTENLKTLATRCLQLAREYDMKNLVKKALSDQLYSD